VKIIAKRKFRSAVADKEYVPAAINTVVEAPEWIRQDDHFKALKRAGLVVVMRDEPIEEADDEAPVAPVVADGFTVADVKDALGAKNIADTVEAIEAAGHVFDGKPTGKTIVPAEVYEAVVHPASDEV
jgi:hypothetical protein